LSTQVGPRHALLISGDIKFLEATERSLRKSWSECLVHRIHPAGDPNVLRLSLAEPGTLAVVDRRFPLKLELNRMISRLPASGGSVVAVSAVPRKLKDMQQAVFDDGFGLLSHNLDWESPQIAQAIAAAHDFRGLTPMDGDLGQPIASDRIVIKDSKHKSVVVEELADKLGDAGLLRTRRGKIASVVDELLMNALYHAAKDEGGKSVADLEWTVDEKGAFRSTVVDEFGTYTREDAHRKLVSFLANEMVEITKTAGHGGGVGLYLVFKVSAGYRLYVDPGRKTEISIRIDPGAKVGNREVLVYFAPFRPKH
jgi:anti-sigma regulatory factor (Ser/Thr protein kinase)